MVINKNKKTIARQDKKKRKRGNEIHPSSTKHLERWPQVLPAVDVILQGCQERRVVSVSSVLRLKFGNNNNKSHEFVEVMTVGGGNKTTGKHMGNIRLGAKTTQSYQR